MELRVKGYDEPLGETIRRAREAANLSQVEFAARLGVAPRTVQYWEAGNVPRPKHRRAIADFLEEEAA
jgi:transcriptional regulator with XRE-family HTH domain